jgi:hypothetical protein
VAKGSIPGDVLRTTAVFGEARPRRLAAVGSGVLPAALLSQNLPNTMRHDETTSIRIWGPDPRKRGLGETIRDRLRRP